MRLPVLFIAMLFSAIAWADPGLNEPRPGLYTGAIPTPEQLRTLAEQGVGTVIDLRAGNEIAADDAVTATARSLGLNHVRLPVAGAADLTPSRVEHLRAALDQGQGKVLLMCRDGDRAGALLALMAHQEEGLSQRAALSLGRRAGLSSLSAEVEQRMRQGRRR